MTTTHTQVAGELRFGIPYAPAGVTTHYGQPAATATCPVCGAVFTANTHKNATRLYAKHFDAAVASGK